MKLLDVIVEVWCLFPNHCWRLLVFHSGVPGFGKPFNDLCSRVSLRPGGSHGFRPMLFPLLEVIGRETQLSESVPADSHGVRPVLCPDNGWG